MPALFIFHGVSARRLAAIAAIPLALAATGAGAAEISFVEGKVAPSKRVHLAGPKPGAQPQLEHRPSVGSNAWDLPSSTYGAGLKGCASAGRAGFAGQIWISITGVH